MVTKEDRRGLREIAKTAAELGPWTLQTSNSFRRIGTPRGDGDVICAVTQWSDGQTDLCAPRGVLEYVVAAQPAVVLALLDQLDAIEAAMIASGGMVEAYGPAELPVKPR
jgi:hypothetical protein